MKKYNNNRNQITNISNEELQALLEARYGITKQDLEKAKTKKENVCWSKPSTSVIEKTEKVVEHPSNKDKGLLATLALIAGSWLLGKAGSKPQQPQVQPLTAEEEFQITERRLMRDNYLRYLNRE